MTTRTKLFGSLFVLGCVAIVAGAVLAVVDIGQPSLDDLMPEIPAEMLEPLPDIDAALTEIPEFVLPTIDLPDAMGESFQGYEIEIPDIAVTAPETGVLTTEIPPLNFGPSDIQELIKQATEAQTANTTP